MNGMRQATFHWNSPIQMILLLAYSSTKNIWPIMLQVENDFTIERFRHDFTGTYDVDLCWIVGSINTFRFSFESLSMTL